MRCLPERWPRVQRKWSLWVKCMVGGWGAFSTRSATTGKSVTSCLVRPSASRCPAAPRVSNAGRVVCGGSVRDAEAFGYVLRTFQLVEDGDGVVLERYEALSLVVGKDLIVGRAVFPCALARRDLNGGTQIGPVQPLRLVAPNGERFATLARFFPVDLGEVRRICQRFAGRDLEAARSANVEHALHSRIAQPLDQGARVGGE